MQEDLTSEVHEPLEEPIQITQNQELEHLVFDHNIMEEVLSPRKKNYSDEFHDISNTFENENDEEHFETHGIPKKEFPQQSDLNLLNQLKTDTILESEILKVDDSSIKDMIIFKPEESEEEKEQITNHITENAGQNQESQTCDEIRRKIQQITQNLKKQEEGDGDVTSEMRSKMFESRSKRKKFDLSRKGESDRESVFSTKSYRNRSERSSLMERIERSVK